MFELTLENLKKYMDYAFLLAQAESDDEETQVGCVIFSPREKFLSEGVNSFCNAWRFDTLPRRGEKKYEHMIHAEISAIIKSETRIPPNSTLFCTLSPCPNCLRVSFASGVRRVVFKDLHRSFKSELPDFDIKVLRIEGYTILELSE